MSQTPLDDFGSWLHDRIREAGYRSPTAFANTAGLQPSMVLRWINGRVHPTPDALVKAAAALRVRTAEVLARGLGIPELEEAHVLHPLAVRLNRVLTDVDIVPQPERELIEAVVDRILSPAERKYYRLISVSWDSPEG